MEHYSSDKRTEAKRSFIHYRPTTEEFKKWIPKYRNVPWLVADEKRLARLALKLIDTPDDEILIREIDSLLRDHAAYVRDIQATFHWTQTPFTGEVYQETPL